MGETCSLSCKRSSRFESENVRLLSAVNSPFETCFYRSEGIHVLEIHVIAVKIEPPLESKQQRNNSYKKRPIKIARALCTAVILFDFSSSVRQTSGKTQPLFESKQ